jgi:hypothetical protein
MSQKDDPGLEREQISLSSVYRQLDDRLGSDEAPYDVGAGLERLVNWMNEGHPPSRVGSSVEHLGVARLARDREVMQLRTRVIERTASVQARSSLVATGTVAFLSLLAGLGLLFGLPLVPVHAQVAVAVTVTVVDALMAFAVSYIHRTTMRSLQGDLQLTFGETVEPRQQDSRREDGTNEPTRQPGDVKSLELPSKAILRYLRVLAVIFLGLAAAAAGRWLPPGPSWGGFSLTFGGVVFVLFFLPLTTAMIMARRARSSRLRKWALLVACIILGREIGIDLRRRDDEEAPHGRSK